MGIVGHFTAWLRDGFVRRLRFGQRGRAAPRTVARLRRAAPRLGKLKRPFSGAHVLHWDKGTRVVR